MKRNQQKNNIIKPIYRMLFLIVIVLMIQFIFFFNNRNTILEEENIEIKNNITELENSIEKEITESKALESVDTSWRKTMENVEEIARDQLNLIKKDEIVLIPND